MIGSTISHYKILSKLGEGGMGVVYKATDTELDRPVALKFLSSQLTASEEERSRFIREAKAVSSLDHPNICTVYEAGRAPDGQMFIAMAYYEGSPLKEKIEKGRLSIQEALRITIQVAEGLAAAHEKGIIHRDVKPGNIIVTPQDQVKLVDFGLAAQTGRTKLTRTHATIGTAAYMSPEQATGEGADHRSDLWSLGVVFYEMLTARLPFRGEHESALMYSIVNEEPQSIQEIIPEAPGELVHIISRALEKDPGERYQSAEDTLIELRRLKRDTSRTGHPPVASKTGLQGAKRSRWKVPVIGIAAILALIVGFSLFYPWKMQLNPDRTERELNLPFERIGYPSISADGKWLAVAAEQTVEEGESGSEYHMWFGSVDRMTFSQVSDEPVFYNGAAISPDGTMLTLDVMAGVAVTPSVQGRQRIVARGGRNPVWSSDGKRIVYVRSLDSFFIGESLEYRSSTLDGADEIVLHRDFDLTLMEMNGGRYSFDHDVSPDDRMLAYVRTEEKQDFISVVDIGSGTSVRLTHDERAIHEIEWTAFGYILFSSSIPGGGTRIWAVAEEGGDPFAVTAGPNDISMSISDDGSRMVYLQQNRASDIWIMNIDGSDLRRLNLGDRYRRGLTFSPDGTTIAFTSLQSGIGYIKASLHVVQTDGSNLRELVPIERRVADPFWSPDGKHILFTMEDERYYHRRAGIHGYSPQMTFAPDSTDICIIRIDQPSSYETLSSGYPAGWIDASTYSYFRSTTSHPLDLSTWIATIGEEGKKFLAIDSLAITPMGNDRVFYKDYRRGRRGVYVARIGDNGRLTASRRLKGIPSGYFTRLRFTEAGPVVIAYNDDNLFVYDIDNDKRIGRPSILPASYGTIDGIDISRDRSTIAFVATRTSFKPMLVENVFE